MSEALDNPTVQFLIMASLTVATILVSLILYLKQRQCKLFAYIHISSTPLLDIDSAIKGRLRILYDNVPVEQLHLILYKLINAGNIPVKQDEYERPISFVFNKNAQVLAAQVVERDPENLEPSLSIEKQKVVLNPLLLNGRDSITVSMLVKDLEDEPRIDGRIVGVKKIQVMITRSLRYWCVALIGIVVQMIGVLLLPIPYSTAVTLLGAAIGGYGLYRTIHSYL